MRTKEVKMEECNCFVKNIKDETKCIFCGKPESEHNAEVVDMEEVKKKME